MNNQFYIQIDRELQVLDFSHSPAFGMALFKKCETGQILEPLKRIRQDLLSDIEKALSLAKTSKREVAISSKPRRWISITTEPVVQKYFITGVLIRLDEITLEKTKRQRADLALRMHHLSSFASHLGHALNNPMAAILNRIGFLLLSKDTNFSRQALTEELRAIQERIYAMSMITNALESFSMDTKAFYRLLDVRKVLEKSIELAKLLPIKAKIRYEIDLGTELPFIRGNEITLEQSFINIIRNALEAMPDGGTLFVSSHIESDQLGYISVTIRDTGYGIAPEHMDDVFE